MECPVCNKEPANQHDIYGVLPCNTCQDRQSGKATLSKVFVDFTTDEIKLERKKYAKYLIQPHRSGYVSKEFCEAYPEQAKARFKPKEIKNARYVWGNS